MPAAVAAAAAESAGILLIDDEPQVKSGRPRYYGYLMRALIRPHVSL